MASGDVIQRTPSMLHVKLLDALVAVDDGVWIDTGDYKEASIHVSGVTTATVKINGSGKATKPTATTHDIEMSGVTADAIVDLPQLPRWLKARISAWTSGTISVFAVMRRER